MVSTKGLRDSEKLRLYKGSRFHELHELYDLLTLEEPDSTFYEVKGSEMKEFKKNVERFAWECQVQIENLKNGINEVKSRFVEFQGSDKCTSSSEIAAAEKRECVLLAMKEEVNRKLASNYQTRARLQKQLQDILKN
ncbi:hypothetical protein ACLB2K_027958 [Fragaria x ananassa]